MTCARLFAFGDSASVLDDNMIAMMRTRLPIICLRAVVSSPYQITSSTTRLALGRPPINDFPSPVTGSKQCRTTAMGGTVVKKDARMGLKQLFDEDSSTYTYLLWDTESKDAVLVDPVDIQVDRDMKEIDDLGLNLVFGINTHAHADHITGTHLLRQRVPGMRSVISQASGAACDVPVAPGDRIAFGGRFLSVRATPGHTVGCVSYVADDDSFVLTGDALLIQGCGRTDFQGGSAATLYDSVWSQIFTLPDDTVVYPAHDYQGRPSSTVGSEKRSNPRLGEDKTKEEFVEIMANLNLAYPKHIDRAVPANMRCGVPDV